MTVRCLSFVTLCLLSLNVLGVENLWLRYHNAQRPSKPMGLFVSSKKDDGDSKTYMVVTTDNAKSAPSLYLTYNYYISDIMPPWTDSEFIGLREDGKIRVERRKNVVGYIEDSRAVRKVKDRSISTDCGFYGPDGKELKAYCPESNSKAFRLLDINDQSLANFNKHDSDRGLLKLEDRIKADIIYKSMALMLSSLKM